MAEQPYHGPQYPAQEGAVISGDPDLCSWAAVVTGTAVASNDWWSFGFNADSFDLTVDFGFTAN